MAQLYFMAVAQFQFRSTTFFSTKYQQYFCLKMICLVNFYYFLQHRNIFIFFFHFTVDINAHYPAHKKQQRRKKRLNSMDNCQFNSYYLLTFLWFSMLSIHFQLIFNKLWNHKPHKRIGKWNRWRRWRALHSACGSNVCGEQGRRGKDNNTLLWWCNVSQQDVPVARMLQCTKHTYTHICI